MSKFWGGGEGFFFVVVVVMKFLFVSYLDAIGWRENISGTVKNS